MLVYPQKIRTSHRQNLRFQALQANVVGPPNNDEANPILAAPNNDISLLGT